MHKIMKKSEERKSLVKAIQYLEMKAFANDELNLATGLKFAQLLGNHPQKVPEIPTSIIEGLFNQLKEDLG